MRKSLVVMMAAMLVFAVAGSAVASFEDSRLIRVILDTTSNAEVGSDVGAIAAWGDNVFVGDVAGTGLFAGGLSDLRVAYFAADDAVSTTADYWATGFIADGDGLTMGPSKGANLAAVSGDVQIYYGSFGAPQAVGERDNANSYWKKMDNQGLGVGSFGGSLIGPDFWEMDESLENLSTVGYVDQILYKFDYNNARSNVAGTEVAVIRTFLTSDGQNIDLSGTEIATVINPNAVPVPASLLLLGSGLLGVFGIRKSTKKS